MTTTRDYLDEVEAQLMAATAELANGGAGRAAARARRRWRWEFAAVIPALATAAAIVAIVLMSAGGGAAPRHHATPGPANHRTSVRHHVSHPVVHRHHHVNPTAPMVSTEPGGPVPPGFVPMSFTAVSELQWWVLGRAPCSTPYCTSIVRTDDGGRTFVGIPAPRTNQVFDLRFANARDGYAYGPQLWVTHDAGRHWHQRGPSGSSTDIAIGAGYAYALVQSGHYGSQTGRLMRSPIGSDTWTALPQAGNAVGGLWAYGHDVLLESADAGGQSLLVSHDSGTTFSHFKPPPNVICEFDESAPGVVWAPCVTGTMSGVWRSTDGGAHFTAVGGDATRSGVPSEPNQAVFAAATAGTAVFGYRQLYRTTDAGAHWSAVPTPAGVNAWRYFGFTDATHGVALGWFGSPDTERLYYTTDAGASYHRVTFR